MRRSCHFILVLFLAGSFPQALWGQDAPPPAPADAPPPGLAEVELARSRNCVGSLARLAELTATLEPIAQRLARLNALGRAVSLEKASDVIPFVAGDPIEDAVASWFAADSTLAAEYLASADSSIQQDRADGRASILARISEAIQAQMADGRDLATQGTAIREEGQVCEAAILVREAVLEACATTESPICEVAEAVEEANAQEGFVESPADLWDIEQYRPWSQPTSLQPGPNGGMVGARTSAQARRGNVTFSFSLSPLIQRRSELSDEEIQVSLANLDSLGFIFEHPDYVMAPGLEFQAQLPAPLGGETHYVLHFGDLTGDDIIWTVEAGSSGLVHASFPASEVHLARLRAGEPISLTALRVQEGEEAEAEGVFTLTLLQVGQAANVTALLEYMANGSLGQDLETLVPAGG